MQDNLPLIYPLSSKALPNNEAICYLTLQRLASYVAASLLVYHILYNACRLRLEKPFHLAGLSYNNLIVRLDKEQPIKDLTWTVSFATVH